MMLNGHETFSKSSKEGDTTFPFPSLPLPSLPSLPFLACASHAQDTFRLRSHIAMPRSEEDLHSECVHGGRVGGLVGKVRRHPASYHIISYQKCAREACLGLRDLVIFGSGFFCQSYKFIAVRHRSSIVLACFLGKNPQISIFDTHPPLGASE